MNYIKLNDGNKMPMVAFGVYQIKDAKQCEEAVLAAIKTGYRLIDTAQAYYNEEAVGNAVKKCGLKREELFITTKVWVSNFGYEKTKASVERSLKRLQMSYVDLVLLHQPFSNYHEAYRALADLQKEGKIKSIGVSNFYPGRLADICLLNESGVIPAVNQIEINPFFQQEEAVAVNHKYNVVPQAWAPFAEGKNNIFTNEILVSIGKKYNKSAAQVILRWLLERNIPFAVKSVNEERIKQNFDIFDFKLDADDLEKIKSLDTKKSSMFEHQSVQGPELVSKFVKITGEI
ncbi:aldo/keto reductase [Spiroplasma endosymbiont of Crioceris asparagi]|uniref:aldo/keto reductase n=1 Tax=Spiroplasma endosymbiont of Crioceris asparagi TaxID=3066286 RepID=UPI0030CAFA36